MTDTVLAPHCSTAGIEKGWETIWHHANVCPNGCHRHWSLWFLCDVTTMCRVFETSRKQVSFIRALEVGQIEPGLTAGAALCNTSFDQNRSVSPIGAGLCSGQPAAFEVHHRQVGTKTASNQWRFRFQTILFDHTDLLRSFQDHTDLPMHMLMQNWQKLYFTGPQLKASLPLEDLCIFLWWSYCNVNFGMVEACLLLPAETRNCGAYKIKLKSPDWKSSLEISHIEWEAAWNKNPHRAENFHSFLASLMI